MQCNYCGCQDMKFTDGISKKTGKPYAGFKCQNKECGHFEFTKVEQNKNGSMRFPARNPNAPPAPQQLPLSDNALREISKRMDIIIELMKKMVGGGIEIEQDAPDLPRSYQQHATPEDEVPF